MSRLAAFGLHRKELRAWALYDWANSAFITTVITAFYPIYFAQTASAGLPPAQVTARFAAATTLALAVTAVLSPFLGFLADHFAVRKKMLGVCLAVALASTLGLALTPQDNWQLSLVFFGLANIGASASFVFYDSLLPHIARPDEIDRVSSAGYAAGYFGGGLCLAINVAWVIKPELFGMSSALSAMRWAFTSVAVWWGVFSIPLFRFVTEPPSSATPSSASLGQSVAAGAWADLKTTFVDLKKFDQALLLLLAFLIYNDGIGTIIRMTGTYGTEIGIPTTTLITAILVVQFLGIPFTFAFGALAGRIGAKSSIGIALCIYTAVTWVAFRMTTPREFWTLAILVAIAQGGCQALSRSLFASMIPERRSSQFFAFFAVAEKFAGVFGMGLFAILTTATGSGRQAVLSLVIFFFVGAILLSLVNVAKGRQQAAEADAEAEGRAEALNSEV